MTTPSKLLVQEARHLASRVKAVAKERRALRYEQRMFRRRIEKDLQAMLKLQKTWTGEKPVNPFMAVAVALDALLANDGS